MYMVANISKMGYNRHVTDPTSLIGQTASNPTSQSDESWHSCVCIKSQSIEGVHQF